MVLPPLTIHPRNYYNLEGYREGKRYDALGMILVEKERLHAKYKKYDDNLKVIAEGFQSRMPWSKKRQRIAISLELGKGLASASVSIAVLANPAMSMSFGAAFAVFAAQKLSDKAFALALEKVKKPHYQNLINEKLKEHGYKLSEEIAEKVIKDLINEAGGGALVTAHGAVKALPDSPSEFTNKDKLDQLVALLKVSKQAISIAAKQLENEKQVQSLKIAGGGIGIATAAISTGQNISSVVKESRGDLASLAAQVFPFTIEFYKQVELVLNDYDNIWRIAFQMTPERQEELHREGGLITDSNIMTFEAKKAANAKLDRDLDSIVASIETSFNSSIDHTRAQINKLRDGSRVKASAAYAQGGKLSGQDLGEIMKQILGEQTFASGYVPPAPEDNSPVVFHIPRSLGGSGFFD